MWPVLVELGPIKIHSWGLLLMLGALLAVARAAKNAHRYAIKKEDIWDIGLWGVLGGVLGARLVYVLLTPEVVQGGWQRAFYIWEGGMTFYGGLFGGILAGMLVCRLRGIRIPDMADLAAVSFPIGYGLGRIGCFLNGCCYGAVCDLPWAVRFHDHSVQGGLTPPSHPAQLYAALAAGVMYLILLRVEARRRFAGQVMLSFIFLYAIYRFVIEFVRKGATAEVTSLAGLTHAQVASLLIALAMAVAYAVMARRARLRADRGAASPATTTTATSV